MNEKSERFSANSGEVQQFATELKQLAYSIGLAAEKIASQGYTDHSIRVVLTAVSTAGSLEQKVKKLLLDLNSVGTQEQMDLPFAIN
jgi:ribosomal protein S11